MLTIFVQNIDENFECPHVDIQYPERGLSIKNQVKLIWSIINDVSRGKNVSILTHSDFIIREVNNAIMMSKFGWEEREEFIIKSKTLLDLSEPNYISFENVKGFYLIGDSTFATLDNVEKIAIPLEINKYGVRVTELDNIINDTGHLNDILSDRVEEIEQELLDIEMGIIHSDHDKPLEEFLNKKNT